MNVRSPTTGARVRRPVRVARPIAAPAATVWAAISMPGNLELAHPFCESNPVTVWPGSDSVDEIRYLSGWVYERRFVRWLDGVGYDLEIGGRSEPTSFVSWRIEPVDSANCTLTISVTPPAVRRVPIGLRGLVHVAYVRPRVRRYLSSVVRGFEWLVTRGEPVGHNQFGTHPWFSEKRRSH